MTLQTEIDSKPSGRMVVGLWLAGLVSIFVYSQITGFSILEALQSARDFMTKSSFGPLVFLLALTIRPLLLIPSALLAVAGGVFFGVLWGTLYVLLGTTLGAVVTYFLGAWLSDGNELSIHPKIDDYVANMKERGFQTVLVLHLLHLNFDLVSYAAGYVRIDFKRFVGATALGSIPGFLTCTIAGSSSDLTGGVPSIDPTVLLGSLLLFAVTILIAEALKGKSEHCGA